MSLKIYRSIDECRDFWISSQKKKFSGENAFITLEWCEAWLKTVGKKDCYFFSLEDFFLPAIKENGRLIHFGPKAADTPCPFLKTSEFDLNSLSDHIAKMTESNLIQLGPFPFAQKSNLLSKNCETTSQIVFKESSFNDFYKNTNKSKTRNTHSRKRKKLNSKGNFSYHVINSKKEKEYFFEILCEMHIEEAHVNRRCSILSNQVYKQFYNNLLMLPNNKKDQLRPHFSALLLDNECLSIHFGVIFKDRYFWLLPSFNRKYGTYSPGTLHLLDVIQECFEQNLKIFDFSVGNEPYKKQYANQVTELYLLNRAQNFSGLLGKLAIEGKNVLKKYSPVWKLYLAIQSNREKRA